MLQNAWLLPISFLIIAEGSWCPSMPQSSNSPPIIQSQPSRHLTLLFINTAFLFCYNGHAYMLGLSLSQNFLWGFVICCQISFNEVMHSVLSVATFLSSRQGSRLPLKGIGIPCVREAPPTSFFWAVKRFSFYQPHSLYVLAVFYLSNHVAMLHVHFFNMVSSHSGP